MVMTMKDMRDVGDVEITVSVDGRSLWVNVDGQCVCRIQNAKDIKVDDLRPEDYRGAAR